MKRLMLMLLAVVVTLSAQAQEKEKEAAKPNVNKAMNLVRQSKFDEAKAIVDGVPTHSKTMNDAKSWFYRGIVYAAMDTSSKYTGGAKDNSKQAGEAFTKALQIAGPKALTTLNITEATGTLNYTQVLDGFKYKLQKKGNDLFNEEKFAEAMVVLEHGTQLMPEDTVFWQFAGYAAYNAENMDRASEFITKYLELGGTDGRALNLLIGIAYEVKKDCPGSIELARKYIKRFPNNVNLRKIELNCLLELKRYQEATENLKEALVVDPKDVESYYLMGALFEELKNRPEAKKYFEMALKLNPKHLNTNVTLAKIADQEGYKLTKSEMDKLDFKKDKEKMILLDKQYLAQMGEAATRWENVSKIDQNNNDALFNLQLLYGQLEWKDKLAAIVSRLKALGLYEEEN